MCNSNGRLDGCFNGVNNGLVSSNLVGNANGLYTNDANVLNKFMVFEFICDTRNTSTGSSSASQVKLPLTSIGTYNFTVDWGDGSPKQTIRVWNQSETTHTYYYSGVYTIKIEGVIYGWSYNSTGDRNKILSVERWGGLRLASFTGSSVTNYFDGCLNLDLKGVKDCLNTENLTSFNGAFGNSTDAIAGSVLTNVNRINEWDTSNVITMFLMFGYATNFNEDLYFDTSKVISMQQTFLQAPVFNGYVNSWNTSACTTMYQMFYGATAFNQAVDGWDTSNNTDISQMFYQASAFNQAVNSWNTDKVVNMSGMFQQASAFNQPLSGWSTSACTNMSSMFNSATSFNQDINSWDVSKVTTFFNLFVNATSFNNGMASGNSGTMLWNTSACTNMNTTFQQASAFNQNVNSWDTSNVTTMLSTFQQASAFNQPLSGWVTSACTNMAQMFYFTPLFNQPIGNWEMSKVTTISQMFNGATAFDQDIGTWNLSSCTNAATFMSSKTPATFSSANLDAIYNGWIVYPLRTGLTITFGTAKHTSASVEGKRLLSGTTSAVTITNAVNNGSGLIRITTNPAHARTTNNKVFITGVTGTVEANGLWPVTVISTTQVDLQGSTFTNAYVSGGSMRTGYGWAITDGGI